MNEDENEDCDLDWNVGVWVDTVRFLPDDNLAYRSYNSMYMMQEFENFEHNVFISVFVPNQNVSPAHVASFENGIENFIKQPICLHSGCLKLKYSCST